MEFSLDRAAITTVNVLFLLTFTNQRGGSMIKVGIIGGSGLDDPDILQSPQEVKINTPYGPPTSPLW